MFFLVTIYKYCITGFVIYHITQIKLYVSLYYHYVDLVKFMFHFCNALTDNR